MTPLLHLPSGAPKPASVTCHLLQVMGSICQLFSVRALGGCGSGHYRPCLSPPCIPHGTNPTGTHQFSQPASGGWALENPQRKERKFLLTLLPSAPGPSPSPKGRNSWDFQFSPLSFFLTLCASTLIGTDSPSPARGIWRCLCSSGEMVGVRKARTGSWSLQQP